MIVYVVNPAEWEAIVSRWADTSPLYVSYYYQRIKTQYVTFVYLNRG